ncbi:hypothetical protein DL95DRAFT_393329, partial [Leptodontidium sp. 2 PMI_412]
MGTLTDSKSTSFQESTRRDTNCLRCHDCCYAMLLLRYRLRAMFFFFFALLCLQGKFMMDDYDEGWL